MVDEVMVVQVCTDAVGPALTGGCGGVLDVVSDPLDGSVWVRLTSPVEVGAARAALVGHGLGVVDRRECRLQVTGWDVRALRRRLGVLLAGVDDLREEWDATAELVRYHRDRRLAVTGVEPEGWEVLGDVESAMRTAVPIPHRAPAVDDVGVLLSLVEAAGDAYAGLIDAHLEHAATVLAQLAPHATPAGGPTGPAGPASASSTAGGQP